MTEKMTIEEALTSRLGPEVDRKVAEWEGWVDEMISWEVVNYELYWAGPVTPPTGPVGAGFRQWEGPCLRYPIYTRAYHSLRLLKLLEPLEVELRFDEGRWYCNISKIESVGEQFPENSDRATTSGADVEVAIQRAILVVMASGLSKEDLSQL